MAANAPQGPVASIRPGDARAVELLEHGHVVLLPEAAFEFEGFEAAMYAEVSDQTSKNVSFNPTTGELKGAAAAPQVQAQLTDIVARFSRWAEDLVSEVLPTYAGRVQRGRTSYRPRAADHNMSKRKDDRRLHVDAFPANPVQGRRILRVFRNVNPNGEARFWRVGEPFADHAARFLPRTTPMAPGAAAVLQGLGLTKGRRTAYDHLMLQIHDASKEDDAYQARAPRHDVQFAPGATWMVFTDSVVHAALGGRYAFEQTFYLPVEAMADPAASPLKVLERLTGRRLV